MAQDIAHQSGVTSGRGQTVLVIDTSSDQVASRNRERRAPAPGASAFTPDGKNLYAANGASGDVSVIDVASLTVTKRIKIGDSPWGVAVTKDAQ